MWGPAVVVPTRWRLFAGRSRLIGMMLILRGVPPVARGSLVLAALVVALGRAVLALLHGIVQAHKGAVDVVSVPWERTAFTIYLPQFERRDDAETGSREQVRRGQGRVLFMEDDEDQLATIPRVLGKLGYEAAGMPGAAEALQALATTPNGFDAVLTDFDMAELL